MAAVSSTTSNASTSQAIQIDAMKKAQDVQAQQILKVLENVDKQSQQTTAQKTGMGGNINLTA
ncbi:hypothetical protein MNB_SM-6-304 [hydrothermal vent metagenome]|uniref:Motility protein n=1 Tax=hydrothermal vent metagenome TaxID=652676 RepID=A0A1W1CWU5_9ZZZZ